MKIKHKFLFVFLLAITAALSIVLYKYGFDSAVLNPKGIIGLKQRDLMYIAISLMLIVVIPVFILLFAICVRYRSSNKEAKYMPEWDHDVLAECIWWGFPFLIIIFLSVLTWKSTYELDPYKPLQSSVKPLRIQVVALQWKWLFLYPDYQIASVNFFQFPEKTPLNFEITADAPMNSFWVPELGGQIYAMPGMNTQLHLIADDVGEFKGSSANLSGEGFASMIFTAKSSSHEAFNQWLESVQESSIFLTKEAYNILAQPSSYNPEVVYSLKDDTLYDQIIMKYMMPEHAEATTIENPQDKDLDGYHNE